MKPKVKRVKYRVKKPKYVPRPVYSASNSSQATEISDKPEDIENADNASTAQQSIEEIDYINAEQVQPSQVSSSPNITASIVNNEQLSPVNTTINVPKSAEEEIDKSENSQHNKTVSQTKQINTSSINETEAQLNDNEPEEEIENATKAVSIEFLSGEMPILKQQAKPNPRVEFIYNPEKELILNGRVYEKDQDIYFYDILRFVPNYDIVLYKEDLDKKLGELVRLLKEYPEKKVVVYGHGGLENPEDYDDVNHQTITVQDTIDNTIPGMPKRPVEVISVPKLVRFYYGANQRVYDQVVEGLGNEDAYQLKRIQEENKPIVTEAQIGALLYARAKRIERYLVENGISKKRIIAKRGRFEPFPNHVVEVKIF